MFTDSDKNIRSDLFSRKLFFLLKRKIGFQIEVCQSSFSL